MKKIKNETGSITTMVTVTIIFFITILSSAYMLMAVQRKAQLKSQLSTREAYQEEIDNANEIYYTLIGDDKSDVNEVPIPDGFVYVGGTRDSGLVISDNNADKEKYKGQTTVGTDLVGNQFVWIPVDSITDYKRTAYSTQVASGITDTATNSEQIKYSSSRDYYFTEALPADEKTSVETNKGFYIGRYEAGDKESTEAKTLRKYRASTDNTITVKAGQAPYNHVTRTQAKSLAEGFSTKQGYTSVKSKLISSYAWDTAIAFIQKTNSDYGNSSEEGNYIDTTFTYTGIADTEKNKQTKANGTYTLIPTGQTTAVNNIYDMGGNALEWTTESYSNTFYPYTYRGGSYNYSFAVDPAGDRLFRFGRCGRYPRVQVHFIFVDLSPGFSELKFSRN